MENRPGCVKQVEGTVKEPAEQENFKGGPKNIKTGFWQGQCTVKVLVYVSGSQDWVDKGDQFVTK